MNKTLLALALASLPEKAMIKKLASQKVNVSGGFTLEDAKEAIRATFPEKGSMLRLSQELLDEVHRQTPIRDARKAEADAAIIRSLGFVKHLERLSTRDAARQHYAAAHFGNYFDEILSDEAMALLYLTHHDRDQSYEVIWKDISTKPLIAAVVIVKATVNNKERKGYFLLYKFEGKIYSVPYSGRVNNVRCAFIDQVPYESIRLYENGYDRKTDFVNQTITFTKGDDVRVLPWEFRISEEDE